MIGYLALLVAFVVLFFLSLGFAFREWLWPRDDGPLVVDAEYVRVENYFGSSFRTKMKQWLEGAQPVEASGFGAPVIGVLERANGERILLLGAGKFGGDRECDELVCCEGALTLPDGAVFRREIYCRGNAETGASVRLQALASDGDVTLGENNRVSRWIDAQGKIWICHGTSVTSRVSSQDSIRLETGVSVESLYAPFIFTEGFEEREWKPSPQGKVTRVNGERIVSDTVLVSEDLELAAGSRVEDNLVVRGVLRSGADCVFLGDVKAGRIKTRASQLGGASYCLRWQPGDRGSQLCCFGGGGRNQYFLRSGRTHRAAKLGKRWGCLCRERNPCATECRCVGKNCGGPRGGYGRRVALRRTELVCSSLLLS
jgi:hypothetical protein